MRRCKAQQGRKPEIVDYEFWIDWAALPHFQHDSRIIMRLCKVIIGPSPKSSRYRCVVLHCTPTKTIRIKEIRMYNKIS